MPPLTGRLPVIPVTDTFVGTAQADGQTARITALALTTAGNVAILSLVGNDTTLSAICARLIKGDAVMVDMMTRWDAPTTLRRDDRVSYRQIKAAITNTREKHYLILPHTADISAGLDRPDALQQPATDSPAPTTSTAPTPPRLLLANHQDDTPHPRSFLGHLRALRIVFLPHWADALWTAGVEAGLITPLPAVGMTAWQIDSQQHPWHTLVRDMVRAKRLTHAAA